MITSAQEFIQLAWTDDPEVLHRFRWEPVADHVWDDLVANHPDICETVILSKTVPLRILQQLARDPSERVRSSVAMKRKLDVATFWLLARDHSSSVRHSIACNRKAPLAVLRELAKDVEEYVAAAARERVLGDGASESNCDTGGAADSRLP